MSGKYYFISGQRETLAPVQGHMVVEVVGHLLNCLTTVMLLFVE